LIVVPQTNHWQKLKSLVLDSVSSPITRRVYNLGLDEFFAWLSIQEPRPGFTKATVSAWRVALEARGLGAVSINVRITAVRKLAVEASDNGLLAPELANGITRVKQVASKGVRLGNWLSVRQAQTLLNAPDIATTKGLRDRAILAVLLGCGLRRSEVAALTMGHVQQRDGRWCIPDLIASASRRSRSTRASTARLAAGSSGGFRCFSSLRSLLSMVFMAVVRPPPLLPARPRARRYLRSRWPWRSD
jgi:site-specific recombinase XerD